MIVPLKLVEQKDMKCLHVSVDEDRQLSIQVS
jgi:hypothetical protein